MLLLITSFMCYILAVVPIGYDPLLDQAGETPKRLVHNCILCTFVLLSFYVVWYFDFV